MPEHLDSSGHTIALRLLGEGLQPVVDVAAREGIRISAKTALRWAIAGIRGVRLETVKVGGRRMTSRAAVCRFIAATQHGGRSTKEVLDPVAADGVLRSFELGRRNR